MPLSLDMRKLSYVSGEIMVNYTMRRALEQPFHGDLSTVRGSYVPSSSMLSYHGTRKISQHDNEFVVRRLERTVAKKTYTSI